MKKLAIISLFWGITLNGQDVSAFAGSLSFNYSGLGGTGTFSADFEEDTTTGAGATILSNEDTTFLMITAFIADGDSSVDMFMMLLRDTTGAGFSDDNVGIFNPLDPFPSVILMEDIDSAFAESFLDILPDSADIADSDSTELFTDSLFAEIIGLLISNAYVNVSGAISFTSSDSDSVAGSFNALLTPTNPFYAKTITNGQFSLYPVEIPMDLAVDTGPMIIPQQIEIRSVSPNPFNPSAEITFSTDKNSFITLDIFDISGAHVQSLTNGTYRPGTYSIVWHPGNQSAGVYFVVLSSPSGIATRKLIYLK